jgi:hypothetical protein
MAKYKIMPLGVLDTERDLYIPETDAALWGAYQDWLTAGNTADVFDSDSDLPMEELLTREFRMSRVSEDLIDVLITKGVIVMADLPQDAQDRIAEKKWLRVQLGL